MPYYIYIVTASDAGTKKSVEHVSDYENFKLAKTEVRRLRTEAPLNNDQTYKIIFADDMIEHIEHYAKEIVPQILDKLAEKYLQHEMSHSQH